MWGDQRENINGKLFVRVTHHKRFEDDPENFGYKERLKHVALIGDGARSYCIQCDAKDPSAKPREIDDFDAKSVFIGGELIDHEGDSWLELTERPKVSSLT